MGKIQKSFLFFRAMFSKSARIRFRMVLHFSRCFTEPFVISFAQGAEDLALLQAFNNMRDGKYIDVGAHNPHRFSVTRILYEKGWTGVNIEANDEVAPLFEKYRKKDVNLFFAVGTQETYNFYKFSEPALNSTNEDWVSNHLNKNLVREMITIKGITLKTVIDTYFKNSRCNLLKIDIEGSDLDALKSIDFENLDTSKYPEWILLETVPPVEKSLSYESIQFAINYGYEPYVVLPTVYLIEIEIGSTINCNLLFERRL